MTYDNQLACLVALETGLRINDVLKIRTDELKQRMKLTEAKTGKKRTVTISKPLFELLKANAGSYYVFEGRLNPFKHRTRQAVWKDLKRASDALRLKGVSPHSLRKVYAVELAKRYSLTEIQKILLHENIEVTLLYALADKLDAAKPPKHLAKK